jgi:hypothetical protein
VTTTPLTGIPGEYDADNDGDISIDELGTAGVDFTTGDLSITELGQIALQFTS